MSDNRIQIEIQVNGERALATLNLTDENLKNLAGSFNQGKREALDFSEQTVNSLQNVRNVVQGLEGMWRTFNATFSRSFDLYERQINAEQRLEAVIRATGGAAGYTAAQLREMAAGLQAVTTFGDEEILEAQAILLTFQNLGGDAIPRVTEAALDMASVFGGTAASNAQRLARALDDPARGLDSLRRTGIAFTKEQEEQISVLQRSGRLMEAQALILQELESRFRGTARAIADTPAGRFRQLQNELGDVREQMGGLMAQGIIPFTSGLRTILELSNDLDPRLAGLADSVGTLTVALFTLQVTGILPNIRGLMVLGPKLATLPGTSIRAAAAVGGLTGAFRAATVAVRTFFATLGPIGLLAIGFSVLLPLIGLWGSRTREAADAAEAFDKALDDLTLPQKRERISELTREIEALSAAIREAGDSAWKQEQIQALENLLVERARVQNAVLMQDRDALQIEIRTATFMLEDTRQKLAAARAVLRRAGEENNRTEIRKSLAEIRELENYASVLQERINRFEGQLRLLQERDVRTQPGLTPEQQQQIEQLRIEVIEDARARELASLEAWYRQQLVIAADSGENLTLLEQAYTTRRGHINRQYEQRELDAKRQFNERLAALEDEFRRLEGIPETQILAERLERIENEYNAEAEGTERRKQLYLDLLQARLDLAREKARISAAEVEDDRRAALERENILQEIARQELEIFEARERLELSRATAGMDFEKRRMAELVLEQHLLLNRKAILEEELKAVQENVDLSIEERTREANAITIQLLRIEQGLEDIDEAASGLDQTFSWSSDAIIGYTQQVLGAFRSMFSSLRQMYQADARRKIEAELRKRNAALDAQQQEALNHAVTSNERDRINQIYEEKREALEQEAARKKEEAARKYFLLEQVASIGQATMSTYEAATKALTIMPPALGIALASILTGAGLANVAAIATQEPPGFADGGLFRGEGGPRDDANLVRVSDGEYIVNASSTNRFLPFLEAMNDGFMPVAGVQMPGWTDLARDIRNMAARLDRNAQFALNRPIEVRASIGRFESAAVLTTGSIVQAKHNLRI